MKTAAALLACVALCAGSALPSDWVPKDNSHYVEGESRYVWVPGRDGGRHLVDLQAAVDEMQFNGNRNVDDTQFWLFTRNNRDNGEILLNGNIDSIRKSNYDPNRPTNVVVHGWNYDGNNVLISYITSALLDSENVNVIVVDWRQSAHKDYISAARDAMEIGRRVGHFIDWLFNNFGGDYDRLHLVGFNFGAHIVGIAGRTLGGRPSRVTGLNPSGVLWRDRIEKLDRTSGKYVETIHTEGFQNGILDPYCHADFYPNAGLHPQPGCPGTERGIQCSDERAAELFASSVRTNHLIGYQCKDLIDALFQTCRGSTSLRMGNNDFGKRGEGIYGLRTAPIWPY